VKFRALVDGVPRVLLYTTGSMLGLPCPLMRVLTRRLNRTAHLLLSRASLNGVLTAHNQQRPAAYALPLLNSSLKRVIATVYVLDDTEWERDSQLEFKIRAAVQELSVQ